MTFNRDTIAFSRVLLLAFVCIIQPVLRADASAGSYATNTVRVVVWAGSQKTSDGDAAVSAEITARQMLLFARGAEAILSPDGIHIKADGIFAGTQMRKETQAGGWILVQLEAEVVRAIPPEMKLLGSKIETCSLSHLPSSIPTVAQKILYQHQKRFPQATGFIVLQKMELLRHPDGSAPKCRYRLEVYGSVHNQE